MASKGFEIGVVVTVVAAVAGGALYMGRLEGRVAALERRIESAPQVGPNGVKLGEICMKLLQHQESAAERGEGVSPEINTQLEKFNCFKGVPASTASK